MQPPLQTDARPPKSLLGQYLAFLKSPTDERSPGPAKAMLVKIWRLYTLHLVLMLPMMGIISLLSQRIESINENQVGTALKSMSPLAFLGMAVVLAPCLEEALFRLPLCFSRFNFGLPMGMFLFILSSLIIRLAPTSIIGNIGGLSVLMVGAFACVLAMNELNHRGGYNFSPPTFQKVILLSSVLFGLIHITNYPKEAWIVTPFLVLPQTTIGVLLAFIRIRFGFVWAVFTHALHNFLLTCPLLVVFLGSDQLRRQMFEQAQDVQLLPRDQILTVIVGIWMLGLLAFTILTTVKLINEWRAERAIAPS